MSDPLEASIAFPPSASDEQPSSAGSADAYLRNPIAGCPLLTPYEAIDAISLLSAMLIADERYRIALRARTAPCDN
jgi:hypothetical protein